MSALGVAGSGDEFAQYERNFHWFQLPIDPVFMQHPIPLLTMHSYTLLFEKNISHTLNFVKVLIHDASLSSTNHNTSELALSAW